MAMHLIIVNSGCECSSSTQKWRLTPVQTAKDVIDRDATSVLAIL